MRCGAGTATRRRQLCSNVVSCCAPASQRTAQRPRRRVCAILRGRLRCALLCMLAGCTHLLGEQLSERRLAVHPLTGPFIPVPTSLQEPMCLLPSLDLKGCGGQACRRSAATRRLQWRSRGSPRCPAGCAPRCSSAALRPAALRVIALLCLSAPYDESRPKPAVALGLLWCWCASAQRRCGAVCACNCMCGVLLRGCGRRGRVHGGWQRAHSGSESTQALLCFP